MKKNSLYKFSIGLLLIAILSGGTCMAKEDNTYMGRDISWAKDIEEKLWNEENGDVITREFATDMYNVFAFREYNADYPVDQNLMDVVVSYSSASNIPHIKSVVQEYYTNGELTGHKDELVELGYTDLDYEKKEDYSGKDFEDTDSKVIFEMNDIEPYTAWVMDNIYYRNGADISYNLAGELKKYTEVNVTGESGNWLRIEVDDKICYITKQHVQTENPGTRTEKIWDYNDDVMETIEFEDWEPAKIDAYMEEYSKNDNFQKPFSESQIDNSETNTEVTTEKEIPDESVVQNNKENSINSSTEIKTVFPFKLVIGLVLCIMSISICMLIYYKKK